MASAALRPKRVNQVGEHRLDLAPDRRHVGNVLHDSPVQTLKQPERTAVRRPDQAAGHPHDRGAATRLQLREAASSPPGIRRARELGFGLDEISQLLRLVDDGREACAEARELTSARLNAVRRKLADLRQLEQALRAMIARCNGGEIGGCPVIDALGGRARDELPSAARSVTSS